MLLVDRRVGSGELVPYLKTLGLPVELTDLAFGDFAFLGRGEGEVPVSVGVERKTVTDLVNSTMTGRFAGHQLPGLLRCYNEIWLLVEGIHQPSPEGILEIPCGRGPTGKVQWKAVEYGAKKFMFREFESLLCTLEVRGGVRVRHCRGKVETGHFLSALYHWWTHSSLEEHRSHLRFRSLEADSALLVPPSLARLVAKELPGIGWKKSQVVAGHFKTTYAMVQADEKEWQKIEGIGKTMATRIVKALRG